MRAVAPILASDRLRIEYPLADGGVLTAVEGATLEQHPIECRPPRHRVRVDVVGPFVSKWWYPLQ